MKKLMNWTAPRPDGIQGYWLKTFISTNALIESACLSCCCYTNIIHTLYSGVVSSHCVVQMATKMATNIWVHMDRKYEYLEYHTGMILHELLNENLLAKEMEQQFKKDQQELNEMRQELNEMKKKLTGRDTPSQKSLRTDITALRGDMTALRGDITALETGTRQTSPSQSLDEMVIHCNDEVIDVETIEADLVNQQCGTSKRAEIHVEEKYCYYITMIQ